MTKQRSGLGLNYWKLWTASVVSNLGDGVALIAYPWLASSLTRNPLHIAGVAVVTRLPWLLFSLPAGVITDRVDRRRLVAWTDGARFGITLLVAFVILLVESDLASPEVIADGSGSLPSSATALLVLIYGAALLLGTAEVFRDNAAQTFMPALVAKEHLEKANGRLWGAEMVMNSFVGPPVAGLLLAVTFSAPLFLDAGTFAVAALLVFLIAGDFRPKETVDTSAESRSFKAELQEGFSWLWNHSLFRPMAIALGVLNGTSMMAVAVFVLFAQEVLSLDATGFGLLTTGVAFGGVLGSVMADRATAWLGKGPALMSAALVISATLMVSGLTSSVWVFWTVSLLGSMFGVIWNVITVSLRQALIPDRLLGRVNSVYRFFGWGMMPIGSLLGGIMVVTFEPAFGRDWALRLPFLVAATISFLLVLYVVRRLGNTQIQAAVDASNSSQPVLRHVSEEGDWSPDVDDLPEVVDDPVITAGAGDSGQS